MQKLVTLLKGSRKSKAVISQESGIAQARLEELMAGAEPSLSELRQISSTLGIDVDSFLSRASTASAARVLFRQTMGSIRPGAELTVDKLSDKIERSMELVLDSEEYTWLTKFEGAHSSYEDSEHDAETFRDAFLNGDHINALISLPSILVDSLGIVLLVVRRVAVDGASVIFNGIPFIFVSAQFEPRMLFTVAHELGHLIAHHSQGRFARFDGRNKVGTIHSPNQEVERYADAFASNVLLPRGGVGLALMKVRELFDIKNELLGDIEILYLAHVYGVSFQVAARRCEQLQLLPTGGARSLYDFVRESHGTPEKRAQELGLPARPKIFFPPAPKKLLDGALRKVRAGEVSIERACESLDLPLKLFLEINRRVSIESPPSEPHT